MSPDEIARVLRKVKFNEISIDEALQIMKDLPFKDLGFAKLDNHRELRVGYPEVIFCAGKTIKQILSIFQYLLDRGSNIIATKASEDVYEAVFKIENKAVYHREAKIITVNRRKLSISKSTIAVVAAGTSDIPIAEEAAVTAEAFGNQVTRHYDVAQQI